MCLSLACFLSLFFFFISCSYISHIKISFSKSWDYKCHHRDYIQYLFNSFCLCLYFFLHRPNWITLLGFPFLNDYIYFSLQMLLSLTPSSSESFSNIMSCSSVCLDIEIHISRIGKLVAEALLSWNIINGWHDFCFIKNEEGFLFFKVTEELWGFELCKVDIAPLLFNY